MVFDFLSTTVHVFVFVSSTTKYCVVDRVSAAADIAAKTIKPVEIRSAFMLYSGTSKSSMLNFRFRVASRFEKHDPKAM